MPPPRAISAHHGAEFWLGIDSALLQQIHDRQPPARTIEPLPHAIATVAAWCHPSVAPAWPAPTYGDSSLTEQGAHG